MSCTLPLCNLVLVVKTKEADAPVASASFLQDIIRCILKCKYCWPWMVMIWPSSSLLRVSMSPSVVCRTKPYLRAKAKYLGLLYSCTPQRMMRTWAVVFLRSFASREKVQLSAIRMRSGEASSCWKQHCFVCAEAQSIKSALPLALS